MGNRNSQEFAMVIDEIQRVPDLLNVVHGMIVDFPSIQFILTGSSARKLRRAGVNLLAGRALLRAMHPFMAAELGDAFDRRRALHDGLLPIVHGSQTPQETLRAYVGTYLEEEVRQEGLVRDVGCFSRFLEVASFCHGTAPNYSAIARECAVDHKTAATYFAILEDLLLAFQVPAFSRRPKRELVAKSKFYLCDVGIFRSLRCSHFHSDSGYESPEGFALEGLIAQHLRAWCDYSHGRHQLFYWKTKSGAEVDFIIAGDGGLWAFEVKSAEAVRSEHLRHLRIFGREHPEAKLCLLYGGMENLIIDDIHCMPWERFLKGLTPGKNPF
jgi:predicted AAA+ superfamily ATPase